MNAAPPVRRLLLAAALLAPLPACSLTEIEIPESQDVLVVEAVLRTDLERQWVLLHRSLAGREVRGEPGATVRLWRRGGADTLTLHEAGSRCFTVDPRYQVPDDRGDSLVVTATCYETPPTPERFVVAGGEYEIGVRTTRGETAGGRVRVPGDFRLVRPAQRLPGAFVRCWIPADTSVELAWTRAKGTYGYATSMTVHGLRRTLSPLGIPDVPDPLELTGFSVSSTDTAVVLPGEFGVFERFEHDQDLLRAIQRGFPATTQAEVTIAAAERNYVNGVRGTRFNPSGQGRISSISGDGVGVFGALVVRRVTVEVGPTVVGPELRSCFDTAGPRP